MLRVVGRSALKQLSGASARAPAVVPREAAALQQKRGMAGGGAS
jgi:hypothetical protein